MKNEILIEKELYAWNIGDVWNIVVNEFKPNIPDEYKSQICDGGISEGFIYTLSEIYDVLIENIPEYVKEYQGDFDYDSPQRDYLYQVRGVGNLNYTLGVLTTFCPVFDEKNKIVDNKNRVIFIELRDDNSNQLYRINYVK